MSARDYPHADRDADEWADTVAADDLAADRPGHDDEGIAADVLGEVFDACCALLDQNKRVGDWGTVGELLTMDPCIEQQTAALLAAAAGHTDARMLAQDAIDRSRGALIRRATFSPARRAELVEWAKRVRPGAFR